MTTPDAPPHFTDLPPTQDLELLGKRAWELLGYLCNQPWDSLSSFQKSNLCYLAQQLVGAYVNEQTKENAQLKEEVEHLRVLTSKQALEIAVLLATPDPTQ